MTCPMTRREVLPQRFFSHKEFLEYIDLFLEPVALGRVAVEVGLRLWEANSILHVGCECLDFDLASVDSVHGRFDLCLDGGQVVREGRLAHRNYLYLRHRA